MSQQDKSFVSQSSASGPPAQPPGSAETDQRQVDGRHFDQHQIDQHQIDQQQIDQQQIYERQIDQHQIDERQIDRLVDGELNEAQRRELLLALDRSPDGWRRCALAFLEAQCWGEALRAIGHRAHAAGTPSPAGAFPQAPYPLGPAAAAAGFLAAKRGKKAWPWLVRTAAGMAIAASLLAAAVLGALWQQWRSVSGFVAKQDVPSDTASLAASTVEEPQHTEDFLPPPQWATADDAQRWHTVTLALHDGSGVPGNAVQLPVREHDHLEEALLEELPASLPPDIWESLERAGCRVVQQRQLMPLPLGDGRMLVVPVDSVELTFVGHQEP